LAIVLVVFAILSAVLRFHWNNYSMGEDSRFMVKSVFWSISFSLIIGATISLLVFELGI